MKKTMINASSMLQLTFSGGLDKVEPQKQTLTTNTYRLPTLKC